MLLHFATPVFSKNKERVVFERNFSAMLYDRGDSMNSFHTKTIMTILCFAFLMAFPLRSEASDLYSIIYTDASQYNGNPAECDWITSAILYASGAYQVDPLLLTAVMESESHFRLSAGSPAGAIGLMQLMPGTAAAVGVNPYDPLDNVLGGASYLRTQLDAFDSWGVYGTTYAIAAYNAGGNAVRAYGGVPPYAETIRYVGNVNDAYRRLLSWAQDE